MEVPRRRTCYDKPGLDHPRTGHYQRQGALAFKISGDHPTKSCDWSAQQRHCWPSLNSNDLRFAAPFLLPTCLQEAMSLGHRIVHFFSGPPAVAPEPVTHSLHNDGRFEESSLLPDFSSEKQSFKEVDMTPDDGLEARPPILHVSPLEIVVLRLVR